MRMISSSRPRGLVALAAIAIASTAAADSKPLARYVPKDDLVVFAEFSGLDAHKEAWRKTATYKMLNETGAGAMLEEVLAQTIDTALASAPEGSKPSGKHVVEAIERWARSGFVVGINGKIGPGATPRVVEVFRDAGGKDLGKDVRQLLDLITKSAGPSEVVTREDGRKVTFAKPRPGQPDGTSAAWWFEGDDLVLVVPGDRGRRRRDRRRRSPASALGRRRPDPRRAGEDDARRLRARVRLVRRPHRPPADAADARPRRPEAGRRPLGIPGGQARRDHPGPRPEPAQGAAGAAGPADVRPGRDRCRSPSG